MRKLVATLCVLALTSSAALAEEIRGQLKSVDASRNTITVMVGSKTQTLECAKDCRVVGMSSSRLGRRSQLVQLSGGMSNLREGQMVVLTTETRSGSEMVTQIQTDLSVRTSRLPRLFNR